MEEEREPDVVQIGIALASHRIDATIFLPFLVTRLRSMTTTNEAMVTVLLHDIETPGEVRRDLKLRWNPDSEPRQPLGVGEKVITELAACGIANIVGNLYAGIVWRRVADEGDGFDYWVRQNTVREVGLEVSGTMTEEEGVLEARHREKVAQLLGSQQRVGGFVAVVSFTLRRMIVSFHLAPGEIYEPLG
ncbi:MAG: hypothetical protein H8F28_04770 [Fibrella sp.]|nr:hypothetical protein [Armatimonadota bacterium]